MKYIKEVNALIKGVQKEILEISEQWSNMITDRSKGITYPAQDRRIKNRELKLEKLAGEIKAYTSVIKLLKK